MTFENLGRGEINVFGYTIKKILHGWRFITNYNLPVRAKKNVKHHYDNNRVVPYAYLREADVMWQKRYWRVIDLREKIYESSF